MDNRSPMHNINQFSQGYKEIISPYNSTMNYISIGTLQLKCDETYSILPDSNERVLLILSGQCRITTSPKTSVFVGARESVFTERASAFYCPRGYKVIIKAIKDFEMIIASAPTTMVNMKPKLIVPSDIKSRIVGRGNWEREVFDIVGKDFAADKLIVGETYNYPGNWSSSPPHKHDLNNPPTESNHEEVYFYKVMPEQGFGLQRIYSAEGDIDISYVIKNNTLLEIPRGYHPVVAAPGYKLYYTWVLAGDNRNPIWNEDPAHKWVNSENIA